ncbi:MAG: pyridoxal phosphate-dependent decarboxylase family protein [Planctomycetota bacterium]
MLTLSEFSAAQQRIASAYDPELARGLGHQFVEQLAEHLGHVEASEGMVLPWREPDANVRDAAECLDNVLPEQAGPEEVMARFRELVGLMLERGNNLHDPRYIGHQVPASVPLAAFFDAVGAATNQPMAIYEMGPWATAAEFAMVERLGQRIGWDAGTFAGMITHGGSLANLTALLTARNVMLPTSWEKGPITAASAKPPLLLVHNDAHYSVSRSAGILGLGTAQVVRVGLDTRRRMDPNQLDDVLRSHRNQNRDIVAVVACCCSTPIGAFDPLRDIAEVCQRHGVWLHVDAAHGGSACLSPRYRHLVDGLERADSLAWDAHKMLFMPALCAFVFLRDKTHRFETFRQEAPYLFDPTAPGLAEYDSGLRTVECTKRAAAFGLWGMWCLRGQQLFTDMIDVTFEMGRIFHEKLVSVPDFEPLHQPECNIVVFRYRPKQLDAAADDTVGQFQLALRRRLIESGEFYIVSTKIDGIGALRITIINPLTTPDHLDQLLDALRRHGQKLLASGQFADE